MLLYPKEKLETASKQELEDALKSYINSINNQKELRDNLGREIEKIDDNIYNLNDTIHRIKVRWAELLMKD